MEKITKIIFEGRTFHILKDDMGYWGIEDKHIKEENGQVSFTVDASEGHLRDNLAACLTAVEIRVRIDKLIATGKSEAEAAIDVIFG